MELSNMDAYLDQLSEGLRTGDVDKDVYSAKVAQMSGYREIIIGLVQKLEEAGGRLLDMFSQLIKAENESQLAIIRNQGNA